MRRLTALAALLLLTACRGPDEEPRAPTPKHDAAAARPGFVFRGLRPGVTTLEAAKAAGTVQDCRPDGDQVDCDFARWQLADEILSTRALAVFKDGRFDWMSFAPKPEDYDRLVAALTTVYGPPCATRSKPLQNAYGAQVPGDETVWCFKDGNLTLQRHESLTKGALDFYPLRAAAPEPARTTDNL